MNPKLNNLLNDYQALISDEQKALLLKKTEELLIIAYEIQELKIPSRWVNTWTDICFSRGWIKLSATHKEEMYSISKRDSEAVFTLANYGKKVGVSMLYKISADIDEEQQRQRAVSVILEKGTKEAEKELDSIILAVKNNKYPNLFDF